METERREAALHSASIQVNPMVMNRKHIDELADYYDTTTPAMTWRWGGRSLDGRADDRDVAAAAPIDNVAGPCRRSAA